MNKPQLLATLLSAVVSVGASGLVQAQQPDMTFFVTSVGPGKGADLGGLAGADKHCQSLATAAGAGGPTPTASPATTSTPASPAAWRMWASCRARRCS